VEFAAKTQLPVNYVAQHSGRSLLPVKDRRQPRKQRDSCVQPLRLRLWVSQILNKKTQSLNDKSVRGVTVI
jgi:hypothetical protein